MTKIKPCPLCGSTAEVFHDAYTCGFGVACTRHRQQHSLDKVSTCYCVLLARYERPETAIEHWNKRSRERNVKRSRIHQDKKADV